MISLIYMILIITNSIGFVHSENKLTKSICLAAVFLATASLIVNSI